MRPRLALLALFILGLGACAADTPEDQGAVTAPTTAGPDPTRRFDGEVTPGQLRPVLAYLIDE